MARPLGERWETDAHRVELTAQPRWVRDKLTGYDTKQPTAADVEPDEPVLDDEMRSNAQAHLDAIDEDGPDEDEDLYRADVGDNNLKHYWTRGKGLRKWATSAHPWTALYRHLVKHVGSERAKRMASEWFHDVFGIWSGHRKGSNPVGPG